MVLQLFGFIFQIIGSMLTFWLTEAKLDGSITFGGFILVVFIICFVLGKLLGIVSHELNDYDNENFEKVKKEFSSKMSYKPRHSDGPKHAYGFQKERRYTYVPKHEKRGG